MKNLEFTMGYLISRGKLLMTHRIGDGKDFNYEQWIVPGGHVEPGEMAIENIEREFQEETGLRLLNAQYKGMIKIDNRERTKPDGKPFEFNATLYLFNASRYSGIFKPTDDKTPPNPHYWVPIEKVNNKPMHEGDKIMWQLIRSGNIFEANFIYKKERLADKKVHVDEYKPREKF